MATNQRKNAKKGPKGVTLEATVTLRFPILDDGETITEIKFPRRPRGGDFFGLMPNFTTDVLMTLASRVSGISGHIFDKMDGSDVLQVQTVVLDFLESGLTT